MKRSALLPAILVLTFIPGVAHSASKPVIVGGTRPVTVNLPADTSKPSPLLIMLHSASTSGAHQERYMKLAPVAKKLGMIYIAPNGTVGADGRRVWNAAKACCQKSGTPVDDIAYIESLINEIDAKYPVDRSRIYLIGHSNGAFMAIKYACTTGLIAGVVSLAGAMDKDSTCASGRPFAFLQIHGVADPTIKINGGVLNSHSYTSALGTLEQVAKHNKCDSLSLENTSLRRREFEPTIAGQETSVKNATGCEKLVEFWRISGGSHSPRLPTNYAEQVLSFLAKNS